MINTAVICPERKRLLTEYRDAVHNHYEAVRTLVDCITAALGSDVDLIRRNCRARLEQAEQARLALYRHEANHFCDRFFWQDSL